MIDNTSGFRVCVRTPLRTRSAGVCLSFPHEGRVAHISLVFREMWDATALSL
jgi:hypothetical protein